MNPTLVQVTERIIERSKAHREAYLHRLKDERAKGPARKALSCSNLAHGYAACQQRDKMWLRDMTRANIGIVSAYNDILSAHQPYEGFPTIMKKAVAEVGAVAQFAGGVPAMCDGVIQGQDGMDLSLMSRDVIAMSTALALAHNMFDGALLLGICDKIVPGLLIGALSFGHLPMAFVPSGPMPTGLDNKEKMRIRQLFAEGKVGRDALLQMESKSYHRAGTCTFYGTANTNQMVLEVMGLQLPGSSFVAPNSELRHVLTRAISQYLVLGHRPGVQATPLGLLVNEQSLVNGLVAMLATGGSTNHTIHMVAIARAAGIDVNWDDIGELSDVVPLIARIYPNGPADINHFQAAGGVAVVVRELLAHGLLHTKVPTVAGEGLERYTRTPLLEDGRLVYRDEVKATCDNRVITSVAQPFSTTGGVRILSGNLGRAVMKTSAVASQHLQVTAPAAVFNDPNEVEAAFKRGKLDGDRVVVVRFQGPKANGMPELHSLIPVLGVMLDRDYRVALVTDGRLSGASGKVPAAIHVTPEALADSPLSKIRNGDLICVDGASGKLELLISEAELAGRERFQPDLSTKHSGMGRELFHSMRALLSSADQGASSLIVERQAHAFLPPRACLSPHWGHRGR